MVEAALSGALGAAILAIVLLHRQVQTINKRVTDLSAQLTAARITALTNSPNDDQADTPPDPDHKKPRLRLLQGGSVALVCTALGGGARAAWRGGPVTALATTAAAAVAGTVYLGVGDGGVLHQSAPQYPSLAAPPVGVSTVSPRLTTAPAAPVSEPPSPSPSAGSASSSTVPETSPSNTSAPTPTGSPDSHRVAEVIRSLVPDLGSGSPSPYSGARPGHGSDRPSSQRSHAPGHAPQDPPPFGQVCLGLELDALHAARQCETPGLQP